MSPELWNILSWVMSGIALLGTIWNAERNKYGFIFWLVSNLYMTIRFAYIGEYAQMCLFFIYFLLAIRGLISWSKKENGNESEKNEKNEKNEENKVIAE